MGLLSRLTRFSSVKSAHDSHVLCSECSKPSPKNWCPPAKGQDETILAIISGQNVNAISELKRLQNADVLNGAGKMKKSRNAHLSGFWEVSHSAHATSPGSPFGPFDCDLCALLQAMSSGSEKDCIPREANPPTQPLEVKGEDEQAEETSTNSYLWTPKGLQPSTGLLQPFRTLEHLDDDQLSLSKRLRVLPREEVEPFDDTLTLWTRSKPKDDLVNPFSVEGRKILGSVRAYFEFSPELPDMQVIDRVFSNDLYDAIGGDIEVLQPRHLRGRNSGITLEALDVVHLHNLDIRDDLNRLDSSKLDKESPYPRLPHPTCEETEFLESGRWPLDMLGHSVTGLTKGDYVYQRKNPARRMIAGPSPLRVETLLEDDLRMTGEFPRGPRPKAVFRAVWEKRKIRSKRLVDNQKFVAHSDFDSLGELESYWSEIGLDPWAWF